ncbi:SDR family oxidoreductase [Actibacterium lipolyticum]|uniref:NAD dependent epimerase/dehydratase family protein n=1 Tax=Actibacterium lipolyticum TaxID=1524263 RepID=A0A238JV52_9RHOB|nr:SDR family oxidoreductase [Actibacterium lipolyticum]SMX33636.1 NAD dependent epimerase/dehydratase family protein [Actibacterium lipolyticum]
MPKAVVLGGYGLIGSACMRSLRSAGYQVIGVGRSHSSAQAADPAAQWLIRDIPSITPDEWRTHLAGVDVVVNASGALQNGARDDLGAIHVTAVERLVEAAQTLPCRIVQISAAGVSATASTKFFRTKARGDAVVSTHAKDWVILRPTLVLSADAYGGTALLRAAASIPLLAPVVLPDAQIQTVFVGDVAAAVVAAADGKVPSGTVADLTESKTHSFPDLTATMRRWLGFPAPVFTPKVPRAALGFIGRIADLLGHLGWRSPLRTTALKALGDGIRGDPTAWEVAGGAPCRPLEETLSQLPATRQERLFARANLTMPLAIGTLALFWVLSGLIALFDVRGAMAVLADDAMPAGVVVVGGAVADITLGLLILWRPWAKRAALSMIALSLAYLGGSVLAAPQLWLDPLGPMVKVLPGIALAAVVWMLMEER